MMNMQTAARHDVSRRQEVVANAVGEEAQEGEGENKGQPHAQRGFASVFDVLLVGGDDALSQMKTGMDQIRDVHLSARPSRV